MRKAPFTFTTVEGRFLKWRKRIDSAVRDFWSELPIVGFV